VAIGYKRPLLHPVDLELFRGQSWGVIGPNGAGKTTLARTILGLLPAVSGQVQRPSGSFRSSYSPQRHRLHPDYPLSALEVVRMGRVPHLRLGRRLGTDDNRRAREEMDRLGVAALAQQPFRSLSGGQQQRVLLARALATDPDLLVLDEPAEGMDLLGTLEILDFLKGLGASRRMCVLTISHRVNDLLACVDHLCLINQTTDSFEAGRLDEMATPQKLSRIYGRELTVQAQARGVSVQVRT
jgi:ABC-type Mn2+/Zn2+ transport system ATPase subunit